MRSVPNLLSHFVGRPGPLLGALALGGWLAGAALAQPVPPPVADPDAEVETPVPPSPPAAPRPSTPTRDQVPAADPDVETADAQLYSGILVRAADGRITVTNAEGVRLTQRITPETKILRNKQPANLTDLQPGDQVRVVTTKENPLVALTIAAQPADETPPPPPAAQGPADQPPLPEVWAGMKVRGGETGVVITELHPQGPGQAAGLRPGDVILRVNGNVVRTTADVDQALDGRGAGEEMTFTILRGNRTVNVPVTLANAPRNLADEAAPPNGNPNRVVPAAATGPGTDGDTMQALLRQTQENNRLIRQLMGEVQSLRQEVDALKSNAAPANRTE